MKKGKIGILGKASALLVSASIMLGAVVPLTAFASSAQTAQQSLDKDGDGSINYVAIGSYDAAGFGLSGYNGAKYGYGSAPDGSYADLVSDKLESDGMNVELTQLGIGGMRAEELRYLLDLTYTGDKYTEKNFIGAGGKFEKLGGEQALRRAYAEAIKSADIITVDIGFDSFATYALSYIFEGEYGADFSIFDEGMQRTVQEIKGRFEKVLGGYVEDAGTQEVGELINRAINGLAYALTGFCHNLDMSLGEIYKLNPYATVVVTDVRNPVCGINAKIDGLDFPVSLELVYGVLVDLANVYIGSLSAYDGAYYYAYLDSPGMNVGEIKNYSGNPASVSSALAARVDAVIGEKFGSLSNEQKLSVRDAILELSKLALSEDFERLDLSAAAVGKGDFDKISELLSAAAQDPSFDVAASEIYKNIAADPAALSHLAAYIRYELCAVALLDAEGHSAMADEIYYSIENRVSGKQVIKDDMDGIYSFLADVFGREALVDLEYTFNPYYTCDSESYYVAFGDKSVGDGEKNGENGYASMLADKLAAEYGFNKKKQFKSYADYNFITEYNMASGSRDKFGDTPEEVLRAIEAEQEGAKGDLIKNLSKADLVTISYTNIIPIKRMFGSVKRPVWEELPLLGEVLAPVVDQVVEFIKTEQKNLIGIPSSIINISGYLERYAYAYLHRAVYYLKLAEKIHEINPDALVVIVGTYNDMQDIELTYDDLSISLGSYMQYIVDAANLETLCYAMLSENTAYIEAPEVETIMESENSSSQTDIFQFVTEFNGTVVQEGKLLPSEKGHEALAKQVAEKINLVKAHECYYDNQCDERCNKCMAKREVADHVFGADCDTSCNICGAIRLAKHRHTYVSDCDTTCSVCLESRAAEAHTYAAECIYECSKCGEQRAEIGAHSFGDWEKDGDKETRKCSACGHTESKEASGLSTGAVVAIVLGALAVGGGGAAAGFVVLKKKKSKISKSQASDAVND